MQMLRVLISPEVKWGQTICMQMYKTAAAESFNINIYIVLLLMHTVKYPIIM